jgi:tRNA(Ile)-lysidine synthase
VTPDHDLSRRFGDAMADRQLPQSSQAIVLAVSGGADSLGMVALITSWYARLAVEHNQPLPSLTAMIVDHGLRDDSTTEAEQVKSMLESAGINTYVAQITDTPPEHGLA